MRPAPLAFLAAALLLLTAPAAGQVSYYCDCDDPSDGPCGNAQPTAVFGGCLNSLGLKATLIDGAGTTSVSADDLVLVVFDLPPGAPGLLFMGAARREVPFGDGQLCVAPGGQGLFRFPVLVAAADTSVTYGPGLVAYAGAHFPPAGQIAAGERWYLQHVYRDPGGPCGSGWNTSNGVAVLFTP